MMNIRQIIEFLSAHTPDPVPKFIMQKEIFKKPNTCPDYTNAYEQMRQSKWYRELADEQWHDGSWTDCAKTERQRANFRHVV